MTATVRRVGLTGGIGSGKSTVARVFVERGAVLVDTDAIARELTTSHGLAIPALRQAFGDAVISADGALNRDHMRQLAFADAQAKARLEGILHPLIGREAGLRAQRAFGAGAAVVVFDVPLLVESGHWRGRVDRVLVVDCSTACQVQRVTARSGWSEQAVLAVIERQASRPLRRSAADAVIHNEGLDLAGLAAEVDVLWRRWGGACPL